MAEFDTPRLRAMMKDCAGPGEHPELEGEFIDTTYEDLGFDSLAVLELATLIQQDLGVPFPDDAVAEMVTPRNVLDYVNQQIAA
jgi:act minimal PKS acyl carrier protein